MLVKDSKKNSKKNENLEELKKEVIKRFVLKNYRSGDDLEGSLDDLEESPEEIEERVKYFLRDSIGPNKEGRVAVLDEGKILIITPEGNIFGPS